jgi:hypothetical protein
VVVELIESKKTSLFATLSFAAWNGVFDLQLLRGTYTFSDRRIIEILVMISSGYWLF